MKKKSLTTFMLLIIISILIAAPIDLVKAQNSSDLTIIDLSGNNFSFTISQIQAMPKTVVYADLYCNGALLTSGNWGGVQLSYLLAQARITLEVNSLQFMASDGYQVNLPIDVALQSQVIIAYEFNEKPLEEGLRLILPGANGGSWIAKITTITMSTTGANNPEGVSAGAGSVSGLTPSQSSIPNPQTNSITPQPTKLSFADPTIAPYAGNVANPSQPTPTNQSSNSAGQNLLFVLALVSVVLVIAAVFLGIQKVRKLK